MTHRQLITQQTGLIEHLQTIGCVGVGTHPNPTVALGERDVYAVTVVQAPRIGNETFYLAQEAGFKIDMIDFDRGELVLIPAL